MVEPGVGPLHGPLVPIRLDGAWGCLPEGEGVAAVLGLPLATTTVLLGHDDRLRLIVDAEDAREGFGCGLNS